MNGRPTRGCRVENASPPGVDVGQRVKQGYTGGGSLRGGQNRSSGGPLSSNA